MGRYPTFNTRVRREDTFFKTREEQARVMSKNINAELSYSGLPPQAQARFEEQHPKYWYETQQAYSKRLEQTFQSSNLRVLKNNPVYNTNPTQGFFPQASSVQLGQKTFTSLDIETDDYNHPISVIAHKFIQGPNGEFQSVGTYQRYYKAHSWDIRSTQAVHGFTASALKSLRKQQGATYGETYKGQEIEDLRSFLGDSIIVGHNIGEFDLQKLFPEGGISNSTIDTLSAARNAWKGAKNSLDHVYYRIFGRTMEQDGLFHHDANADVIASMRIMAAMSKDKGHVGQAIRYVMAAEMGTHLTEYDEYMKSMVAKGNYLAMKGKNRGNLHEVYMKAEDYGLMEYDEDGNKMWANGFHEDVPLSMEELADEQLKEEAARAAAEWANDVKRRQGERSLKTKGDSQSWLSNTVAEQELFQEFNQFNAYKRLGLVQKIASAKSQDSINALRTAAGYKTGDKTWGTFEEMALAVKSAKERERILEQHKRIDKYVKHGQMSEKQATQLKNLTGSYDALVDATEDVIEANQKLEKTYRTIASIKPYDINNLINAAHGQWRGVMGAAGGVVPNFLRNPIGRLGDAAFNAIDRSVSPWNAFNRASTAVLGPASGALMASGHPVAMGIGAGIGVLNGVSQIAGNIGQAKVEMFGLQLQNNLNTLGAMVSWISTPFQLLHKAIKLVTGAFGGLTFKLNNIMGSGISAMSQMGNPLEPMTGVSYLDYQKAGLMDMASLMKGGSTNAAIESMAMMQRDLYRYGKVDTEKMIAANMLGVFSEAFTPTNDTEGAYYGMANKVLRRMQGASADEKAYMMYYANVLNPSLAQTLRSADMLGITDVRQMTDPNMTGNHMYWRPVSNREERQFRRTQFEYGIATQQFGNTKMRFADRLWNVIGRDLYNGLNELVDHLAAGNWQATIESAKNMWANLKETFTKIWEGEGNQKGLGESVSEGLSKGIAKVKQWGMDIGITIIDVWNQIFRIILDKAQGVIAYLSTAQIKLVKGENGWGIDITTIKDTKGPTGNIYYGSANSATGEYYVEGVSKGAKGYAAVIDALFPNMSDTEKMWMDKDSLKKKLQHLPGVIKDGVLTTPTLDLPEYHIHGLNLGENPELIDPLLNYLAMYDSKGAGMRKSASAWLSPELRPYLDESAYNTGLLPAYDKFTADTMNTLYTARNLVAGDTRKLEADINVNVGDKKVGTVQIRNGGLTFDGFRPLSSVGYNKGIEVSSTQVSRSGN